MPGFPPRCSPSHTLSSPPPIPPIPARPPMGFRLVGAENAVGPACMKALVLEDMQHMRKSIVCHGTPSLCLGH